MFNFNNFFKKIFSADKVYLPHKYRSDDVWLASFPKSGNTWVSFILGNALIDYFEKEIEMNFDNLQKIIPDIYVSQDIPEKLGFGNTPRIIKTHELYRSEYKKSIYIIRDPKDTMISYYYYLKEGHNQKVGAFSDFIRSDRGINSWCKHAKSWINKYDVIISYENLKQDPRAEIKKILNFLSLDIPDERLNEAIKKSSFDNMRQIEKNSSLKWKKEHKMDKNFYFIRKGEVRQWQAGFSKEDLFFYERQIAAGGLEYFAKKYNYL